MQENVQRRDTKFILNYPNDMSYRGGHWDFRFCGFDYFLDRFFGFGGHCVLRSFRFLASGFRFS